MEAKLLGKEGVADLVKRMELGLVPEEEIRKLMRVLIEKRLKWGYKPTHAEQLTYLTNFIQGLGRMKIADEIDALDAKMYEIPLSFLQILCGSTLKFSPGYFKDDSTTLDESEILMMDLYCERAQVKDGQSILDLGCGHGGFVLYVAQKYKNCRVTGVTNSESETDYIMEKCKKLGLSNVEIIIEDVTKFEPEVTYDRVFAIALIEHMKNYELVLKKLSKWVAEDGNLFVEHHCHKVFPYKYEDDVSIVNHWSLSGKHPARGFKEWLKRLDNSMDAVKAIFEPFYGSKEEAMKWIAYWRVFCITHSEMYAYGNGEEWMLSQVLFKRK